MQGSIACRLQLQHSELSYLMRKKTVEKLSKDADKVLYWVVERTRTSLVDEVKKFSTSSVSYKPTVRELFPLTSRTMHLFRTISLILSANNVFIPIVTSPQFSLSHMPIALFSLFVLHSIYPITLTHTHDNPCHLKISYIAVPCRLSNRDAIVILHIFNPASVTSRFIPNNFPFCTHFHSCTSSLG